MQASLEYCYKKTREALNLKVELIDCVVNVYWQPIPIFLINVCILDFDIIYFTFDRIVVFRTLNFLVREHYLYSGG